MYYTDVYRLHAILHIHGFQFHSGNMSLYLPIRCLTDAHLARTAHRLEPCGHVHIIAYDGVVQTGLGANVAGDALTRVDTNAYLPPGQFRTAYCQLLPQAIQPFCMRIPARTARRAWLSSSLLGVKTAIMPSPINLPMLPPSSSMIPVIAVM